MLYAQDGPPGPVAVMLFRGVIQASVLLAAYTWATRGVSDEGSQGERESQRQQQEEQPSAAELEQQQSGSGPLQAWISKVPYTAIAASELGLWLFMATGIQVRPGGVSTTWGPTHLRCSGGGYGLPSACRNVNTPLLPFAPAARSSRLWACS